DDVVEIAVPEVLDVSPGEGLSLAVAAARVGEEEKVALAREHRVPARGPRGGARPGRTAVDAHDHRIAPARLDVFRREKPSLHAHGAVIPVDAPGLAPEGSLCGV